MSESGIIRRINRSQHTLLFKVIASCVAVALGAAFLIDYAVQQQRASRDNTVKVLQNPNDAVTPEGMSAEEATRRRETARADAEADAQYINDMLARRADWSGVAVVVGLVTGVVLGFIWIGLGAVAPVLLGLIALVAWRLKLLSPQDVGFEELSRFDIGLLFVCALAILTASFLALMEALKLLLGSSNAVLAVAKNVVAEAVRLRVSLVLIVLLMFGLAALPGLLDPGTPLRYRVQSFLEYGTGGAFWVIAVLVLFLSVGSVTFEQRDRVIWQTMTKPVSAAEYLLGKWLGVVGVAAVLLLVAASGVFAFTEYLSRQKAVGEVAPYVASGTQFVSEDRAILESQVLASRRTVYPSDPPLVNEEINEEITRRIAKALVQSGAAATPENIAEQATPENKAAIRAELLQEMKDQFLAIPAGETKTYFFNNLGSVRRTTWRSDESYARSMGLTVEEVQARAKEGSILTREQGGRLEVGEVRVKPITLRYKVQAGANDPRTVFKVSFWFPGQRDPVVREVPLNTGMTLPIPPSAIDNEGRLEIKITNGDANQRYANESTMALANDGFSVFYAAGSYRLNFFRVVLVLWLKLSFLAMVAIAASTFLSFPVAAMISFGVLLIAEGSSFVWEALNYYDAEVDGKFVFYRFVIRLISLPIAWTFKHYADITPIRSLANGQIVAWSVVLWATILMGAASAVLYAAGVVIFRRRELATYSGQ